MGKTQEMSPERLPKWCQVMLTLLEIIGNNLGPTNLSKIYSRAIIWSSPDMHNISLERQAGDLQT